MTRRPKHDSRAESWEFGAVLLRACKQVCSQPEHGHPAASRGWADGELVSVQARVSWNSAALLRQSPAQGWLMLGGHPGDESNVSACLLFLIRRETWQRERWERERERERERAREREREVSHSLTLDTSHNNGFTSGAFWPRLIYQTGSPSWIWLISVTHLPFLSLLSTVNDHLDIPLAATMTVPWGWLYCSLTTALITEKCSSRCGLFGGLPAGSK